MYYTQVHICIISYIETYIHVEICLHIYRSLTGEGNRGPRTRPGPSLQELHPASTREHPAHLASRAAGQDRAQFLCPLRLGTPRCVCPSALCVCVTCMYTCQHACSGVQCIYTFLLSHAHIPTYSPERVPPPGSFPPPARPRMRTRAQAQTRRAIQPRL